MCGISIFFHNESINRDFYERSLDSLKRISHRGPDDEGIVLVNTNTGKYKIIQTELTHRELINLSEISSVNLSEYNLILGHRRLSIIDLSVAGHQPMKNKDDSWIVFNGEIYNYIEIREELKNLGSLFETNSDTEVVLEAYKIWGSNCFSKFNGMWSIFIWDNLKKQIFLSNDRFGVKPLYYIEGDDFFVLGSEIKQFTKYTDWVGKLNQDFMSEFIEHGFLDTDVNTPYENVFRFPKSSFASFETRNYQKKSINQSIQQYYLLKKTVKKWTEKEAIIEFHSLLQDAVKLRLRSDVKFGFALSGGLDSSAILYTAKNLLNIEGHKNVINGFSAVFPGHIDSDESEHIKTVINDLQCVGHFSLPMEDFNIDSFEKHMYHQDEPVDGTSYFAEWSVYAKAKTSGIKILFNGQGADEVFGGYHHHFYRYCRQLLIAGKIPKCVALIRQFADLKGLPFKKVASTVVGELKLNLKIKAGIAKFDHALVKYWSKINTLDEMLLADFNLYQLPLYLRADDRDSMAHGIESRHPFLDYRLVELGYSLPNNLLIKDGWQKYLIRKAMSEMPESIRFRKDKKGYLTPETIWLNKYKDQFEGYLKYNENIYGRKFPSKNLFNNYALGAWLKVNNIKE